MFFFIQSYSTYHFFKAPKIFSMLFALVKPMLSQVDTPKIKIYGNDKNEWTSAILEEIDADQVPSFYGGTLTDPDGNPNCVTMASRPFRIRINGILFSIMLIFLYHTGQHGRRGSQIVLLEQ